MADVFYCLTSIAVFCLFPQYIAKDIFYKKCNILYYAADKKSKEYKLGQSWGQP